MATPSKSQVLDRSTGPSPNQAPGASPVKVEVRPLGEATLIFTRPSTMPFQYITGFPV